MDRVAGICAFRLKSTWASNFRAVDVSTRYTIVTRTNDPIELVCEDTTNLVFATGSSSLENSCYCQHHYVD